MHVSAARNASMQWLTCARATAGLLYLRSVGTRPSGYMSREANCRTTFRQWRWWKTSTPAIYPCGAEASASTKPCSMLRLSEEMRSSGMRRQPRFMMGCKVRVSMYLSKWIFFSWRMRTYCQPSYAISLPFRYLGPRRTRSALKRCSPSLSLRTRRPPGRELAITLKFHTKCSIRA